MRKNNREIKRYMRKKTLSVLVGCMIFLGGIGCSKHDGKVGVNVSPKPLNPKTVPLAQPVNSPVQPAAPAQAAKTEVKPDAKKSAPTPSAEAKEPTPAPEAKKSTPTSIGPGPNASLEITHDDEWYQKDLRPECRKDYKPTSTPTPTPTPSAEAKKPAPAPTSSRPTQLFKLIRVRQLHEGKNLTPLQKAENELFIYYARADELQKSITETQGWGRLYKVKFYEKRLEKVQEEIYRVEYRVIRLRAQAADAARVAKAKVNPDVKESTSTPTPTPSPEAKKSTATPSPTPSPK
jgi:hypothetical protein